MPRQAFGPELRLRAGHEFRAVYQARHTASDDLLLIYGRRNDHGRHRLGLSVSRKVGNAVVRNRWKRLIREAFRLHIAPTVAATPAAVGLDLIVIPRRQEPPEFADLAASFERLLVDVRRRTERRGRAKG